MIVYHGKRTSKGCLVGFENDADQRRQIEPLKTRLDLANHSPDGFEWGYPGSGPAQLALAILAHRTDAERALSLYQRFNHEVIAELRCDEWSLTGDWVDEWLGRHP